MVPESFLKALDDEPQATDPTVFVASTGVKLKLSPVPSNILLRLYKKIEVPQPPMVYLEEKDMQVENAADPQYVAAIQEYGIRVGDVTYQAYMGLGTEVMSIPEGMEPPASQGWSSRLQDADLFGDLVLDDIPASGKARYVAWLRLYALSDADFEPLKRAIQRISGVVLEDDVADAAESFRGDEGRGPDPASPTPETGA